MAECVGNQVLVGEVILKKEQMPKTEEQKAAAREYNRAYYQANKDKLKAEATARKAAKPVAERRAQEAAYREENREGLAGYNKAYYEENAETIKERAKANAKARRAAETPEERELRLAKMRAYGKRKTLAGMAPAPETLPPPPTEEEWGLSEFKAAVALPPPPVVAVPLPPPPPPEPVRTEAVRATGAGAPVDKRAAKKAERLATFKEDYIQMLNRLDETPARTAAEVKRERETLTGWRREGERKFDLTHADFLEMRRTYEDRFATQIADRTRAEDEKRRADAEKVRAFAAATGYGGQSFAVGLMTLGAYGGLR
jgi:hypothetical protein